MHRIPLLMPTPSILWDRNLPEWFLFERTLNNLNFEETCTFLTILDSEADFYKTQIYKLTEDMYSTVQQFLMNRNVESYSECMFFVNYLILRTPKESPILPNALKIRGCIRYHESCFEQSSKDYEMYLEVYKINKTPNEDVFEVYGHLVVCMYMMRQLLKVKKYFRLYKKYKGKLSAKVLQNPRFAIVDKYIKDFISEIDDIENTAPKFMEDQCKDIPYKGFTSCPEIPAASSRCLYHNNGVYVNDEIAKASVIFVEDPIVQSLNIPLLECEVCYKQSMQQMYTCLDCRYKSYCSLSCLEKDKSAHKDECIGYEQLTILVLDAGSIFRLFVRISSQLCEKIFNPQIFRKLTKAEEVWDQLLELLNNTQLSDFRDLELIKTKPRYLDLSDMQYSTLVATAFRLTIFIERKTDLIDKFYKRLHISSKQKLILIGSMLMRIQANILLNSIDFEVSRKLKTENMKNYIQLYGNEIDELMKNINRRTSVVKDIDKFYDIDIMKDIWQRSEQITKKEKNINEMAVSHLTVLRHIKPCELVHRILSTYKDNIAELYFQSELTHTIIYGHAANQPASNASSKVLCGRIADMSDIDRYMFVKKFAQLFHIHYAEYFLHMFRRDQEIKQIWTLYCPTLRKFKHSCMPNVEVIVLDNGTVIGKSLRKIKKGEQLFVSYTANCMEHGKTERKKFLDRFQLNCVCKFCKMKEYNEPTNLRLAIFCDSCKGIEITPSEIVCPSCNAQYNNLFNRYRAVIYMLENELKMELTPQKSTERDIYVLHLILHSYSQVYFTPQNEVRISIELKMAHFFAIQNFARQAFNIIMEIRKNILKFYGEHSVWFTFYAEILIIIKIILYNNLEDKLYTLSPSDLHDLCALGLYIAKNQKYYIEFYEVFDAECSNVLDNIKALLKWKEKIVCYEVMPEAQVVIAAYRNQ